MVQLDNNPNLVINYIKYIDEVQENRIHIKEVL